MEMDEWTVVFLLVTKYWSRNLFDLLSRMTQRKMPELREQLIIILP